ncbi:MULTISPECIES: hypothetical protein [Bacillus]|uniref:hypothetical protein n=1 Tax=Bacillus TaxID=1386 RepID=UPI000941D3AD|nr:MULTISPECIES: hypothetical protein [Bacillus cereus group]MCQ6521318.1 hypothetical protein [Bacillus paranthracis]MCR6794446.1 hypothetical protein [Bacillus paranthracis]MCU5227991.1 hypothetical protein [Bacillus paranthracis]MCU5374498.1 hypothetical protein [Bacillus pacificus]MEC4602840.1 hypothetical protein [Bacillus paranthracis]
MEKKQFREVLLNPKTFFTSALSIYFIILGIFSLLVKVSMISENKIIIGTFGFLVVVIAEEIGWFKNKSLTGGFILFVSLFIAGLLFGWWASSFITIEKGIMIATVVPFILSLKELGEKFFFTKLQLLNCLRSVLTVGFLIFIIMEDNTTIKNINEAIGTGVTLMSMGFALLLLSYSYISTLDSNSK